MDVMTDKPLRNLCRRLGSAMSVTEFINTLDVLTNHPRYHHRLAFEPYERPLSLQLLGDEASQIVTAAEILIPKIQPDMIDINLGCQSKNVVNRGAGAALLKSPEKIAEIFKQMTNLFDLPITGKIRLGWDEDHLNYLEVAQIIEDNGGAMVAVHGRPRQQAYRGKARWEPIAEIKQALSIPVIGNGDVFTVADIDRMKAQTGCDAVMIGRAAVGNPWIFSRMDRENVPIPDVKRMAFEHLDHIVNFYGERGLITFRKYLKAYLNHYHLPQNTLKDLLTCKDIQLLKNQLQDIFIQLSNQD
jgi:nifR3 family TIM-barrel protein